MHADRTAHVGGGRRIWPDDGLRRLWHDMNSGFLTRQEYEAQIEEMEWHLGPHLRIEETSARSGAAQMVVRNESTGFRVHTVEVGRP